MRKQPAVDGGCLVVEELSQITGTSSSAGTAWSIRAKKIWCSTLERLSLMEFLMEDDDGPTDGLQDTRRTGSTRFLDVSSTYTPRTTRRMIGGGLRIWRLGVRIPRGAHLAARTNSPG